MLVKYLLRPLKGTFTALIRNSNWHMLLPFTWEFILGNLHLYSLNSFCGFCSINNGLKYDNKDASDQRGLFQFN